MSWIEVSLESGAAEADPISEALEQIGAAAVTITPRAGDAILEPAPGAQPLAARNIVTGLFDAGREPTAIVAALVAALGARLGDARVAGAAVRTLADEDWESRWRQETPARCFGHGLWVIPHGDPVPDGADTVVRLDPGLAFGTGAHPTTALCLQWLAGLALDGRDVIDFGCGSGVLAIAAAARGARDVYAVDHDPQALEATARNAALNGVAGRVHVTDDPPPAGVLVANILANALTALAPTFARCTRAGGMLALSGILPAQADALVRHYARWFAMNAPCEADGWVLLTGTRGPAAAD